ncbi:MAG: EAL domain-containing protein [Sulfuritalea sp.]|nr:EAL domain-containing protein [Sulfuritalea sp.]MDP1981797.1 EAL domain-containing protein [Sulfuritalea sp.]
MSSGAAPLTGEPAEATSMSAHIARLGRVQQSLRTLARAVEQSPVSIVVTDPRGSIQYVNPKFEQLTGYASAEVVGRHSRMLGSGERPADDYRELWSTLVSGETWQGEFHNRRKDGTLFWERASISPVMDDQGGLIHYVAVKEDITQRKAAEHELRVAAIAFESQEGMIVTDAWGMILRVNRAFTRITGYSTAEAVGQTPRLLNSGSHDQVFYAAMWDSLLGNGAWEGEIWNRRKNGEVYPEWLSITAVLDELGQVSNYVAAFSDITRHKQAEDKIKHLAFSDPLTGLPNRRLLLDRLHQALVGSARTGRKGALLFIDLDNFKMLNDTRGHDNGDILLREVARRLVACVREDDTVARLGGDEFVVMLEDLDEDSEEAAIQTRAVAGKILAALNRVYMLAEYKHHSTPSMGATLFGDHQNAIEELLKQADLAMYRAKAAGGNTLRFFDPEMQAAVTARASIEADLHEAVQKNQFLLHYQAQVDGSGRLTGAEALVRWQHPERGLVYPTDFIALAEDTGLIMPLGQWVMETACAQLAIWGKSPETADLVLAVNVSARQFRYVDFVDQVLAVLDLTGANPNRLKLEVTESLLLEDVEETIAKMQALKERGVSFSLDDFGTGYSSLSYLKRLPLDQLKIDQSFVQDMITCANDASIATAIVTLARSMGLTVVAEGVETSGQFDLLLRQGCHTYQGFFFGRPGPADMLGMTGSPTQSLQ